MIRTILGGTLIALGLLVTAVAALGLFRLDHVLKRMHATALADTMGSLLTALGVILLCGPGAQALKLLAVVVFLWLTNPIMSHLIANTELLTDRDLDADRETGEGGLLL